MLDGGRIIGGTAILLLAMAGPAWLGSARGVKLAALPKPADEGGCIEPREEMRKHHPALLASWRERVVRFGDRVHEKSDGRSVRISLSQTCLGCHGQASEFCDKCHAQAAVTPSCWGCHAGAAK